MGPKGSVNLLTKKRSFSLFLNTNVGVNKSNTCKMQTNDTEQNLDMNIDDEDLVIEPPNTGDLFQHLEFQMDFLTIQIAVHFVCDDFECVLCSKLFYEPVTIAVFFLFIVYSPNRRLLILG